jgi:hypothetical protein
MRHPRELGHSLAGKWPGHTHDSRTVRAQGCPHDDDLYACSQPGWKRCPKSVGLVRPDHIPTGAAPIVRFSVKTHPQPQAVLTSYPTHKNRKAGWSPASQGFGWRHSASSGHCPHPSNHSRLIRILPPAVNLSIQESVASWDRRRFCICLASGFVFLASDPIQEYWRGVTQAA